MRLLLLAVVVVVVVVVFVVVVVVVVLCRFVFLVILWPYDCRIQVDDVG